MERRKRKQCLLVTAVMTEMKCENREEWETASTLCVENVDGFRVLIG